MSRDAATVAPVRRSRQKPRWRTFLHKSFIVVMGTAVLIYCWLMEPFSGDDDEQA